VSAVVVSAAGLLTSSLASGASTSNCSCAENVCGTPADERPLLTGLGPYRASNADRAGPDNRRNCASLSYNVCNESVWAAVKPVPSRLRPRNSTTTREYLLINLPPSKTSWLCCPPD